jgi:branched-chain amino acid transport system ATP-binding protein
LNLEVSNLEVFYGDVQVIFDVSFNVNEGEIVSIIGSNAAGKSTILKTISGILQPKSGNITFGGQRLEGLSCDKVVGTGIVQVPEGRQLFPAMTVLENLESGSLLPKAKEKRTENLNWDFDVFPALRDRTGQKAGTLSGGQQQMLAIGRAFMSNPKLLMFDEPSWGLAPLLVQQIFKVIEDMNKNDMTVIMVEQNVHHALKMSKRSYVLESGRIVLEGKGEELIENEGVKRAYLGI